MLYVFYLYYILFIEGTLEFNIQEIEHDDSKGTKNNDFLSTGNSIGTKQNINCSSKENFLSLSGYIPYIKAINSIKDLNKLKTPIEKMLLIANLSNEITEAVNEFWSDALYIEKSLLDINADELVAIFIFLIVKCKMPELVYHLNMIREFTTTITRNSMVGYYYTTMEASISYIKSLTQRSDLGDFRERSTSKVNNLSNSMIES